MKLITSIQKKLRKKREAERNLRNMNEIMQYHVHHVAMQENALHSTQSLISDIQRHISPIVVSLTTYSVRIHLVHLVIESISQQTIKPNKIVLWLDENEFSLSTLPEVLKRQMERGLDIKFCSNYKSYKKLYPSISEYPNHDIITLDDDFIYPHDMIEQLVSAAKAHPTSIIGQRAHKIKMNNGAIAPYKEWDKEINDNHQADLNFITTGGGTLFPYSAAVELFSEQKDFLDICPNADDVWVNFMARAKKINRIKVNDPRPFKTRFIHIPDDTSIGLNKSNVSHNGNDQQIMSFISNVVKGELS